MFKNLSLEIIDVIDFSAKYTGFFFPKNRSCFTVFEIKINLNSEWILWKIMLMKFFKIYAWSNVFCKKIHAEADKSFGIFNMPHDDPLYSLLTSEAYYSIFLRNKSKNQESFRTVFEGSLKA